MLKENKEARNILENSNHIPLEGVFNLNNLIDKVGLDYIQSIIDRNDAIAASKLMLGFFKGGEKNEL